MSGLRAWAIDTAERAARTFAQTLAATGIVGSGITGLTSWKTDLVTAAVAALAAVLNAVVAAPWGVRVSASADDDVNLSTSSMGVEPEA